MVVARQVEISPSDISLLRVVWSPVGRSEGHKEQVCREVSQHTHSMHGDVFPWIYIVGGAELH